MNIILSSSNSQPIYEQIVTQIKAMIMSGELKPKDPLPLYPGSGKKPPCQRYYRPACLRGPSKRWVY